MTSFDILLVIVVVVAAVMGYRKGIIMQIAAIGGLVAGVLLCRIGGDEAAVFVAGLRAHSEGVDVPCPGYFDKAAANIALFALGNIAVRIVARVCRKVTRVLALGLLDRLAGAAFTLFEWLLVFSLCMNVYFMVKPETKTAELSTIENGRVAEAVLSLGPAVLGWATTAMENHRSPGVVDNQAEEGQADASDTLTEL